MKIDFIVMAAGNSRRFGKNKLLQPVNNRPLFTCILDVLEQAVRELEKQKIASGRIFVVTQYEEILQEVKRRRGEIIPAETTKAARISQLRTFWQPGIYSPESVQGVSFTIKNGLRAAGSNSDYYMFLTADQPCLRAASIIRLIQETQKAEKGIGSMCFENTPGNPVIFHQKYFPELMALEGDTGGRKVAKKHQEDCCFCPVEQKQELADADTKESLQEIVDYFCKK